MAALSVITPQSNRSPPAGMSLLEVRYSADGVSGNTDHPAKHQQ